MNFKLIGLIAITLLLVFNLSLLLLNMSEHISEHTTITDWIAVIIYGLTLIAAVVAAVIAKKALEENKKQNRPFVTVKIDHMKESINWFRLKVCNEGVGQAFNVGISLELDKGIDKNLTNQEMLEKFSTPKFMKNRLANLSYQEERYSNFISLIEMDKRNGILFKEFFTAKFIVDVTYVDSYKNLYKEKFILDFNEYDGTYKIGKTSEEKLIDELKNINKNLSALKIEQADFKKEFEKAHRDWTEEELREKLHVIEYRWSQRKSLGLSDDNIIYKKAEKRLSIHQIRKQMK